LDCSSPTACANVVIVTKGGGQDHPHVPPAAPVARAGGHVAVAGVVSRLAGLVRTLVLAAVLGVAAVADAYNGANSFPNMVYELLLGSRLALTPCSNRRGTATSGVLGRKRERGEP